MFSIVVQVCGVKTVKFARGSNSDMNVLSKFCCSFVLYFRYYLFKLVEYQRQWNNTEVEQCYDILLNIIVTDTSQLPPIKVGQRLTYSDSLKSTNRQLAVKSNCINIYYSKFGSVPLKYSHVRLDPALFKDNVAKMRKKYLDLEFV